MDFSRVILRDSLYHSCVRSIFPYIFINKRTCEMVPSLIGRGIDLVRLIESAGFTVEK